MREEEGRGGKRRGEDLCWPALPLHSQPLRSIDKGLKTAIQTSYM